MINVAIAVVGLALLVVAATLVSVPLGFAVSGVGLTSVAYVKQYVETQREASRASSR